MAEQRDVRAALACTLGQTFAAHLDAVVVAVGVEEQHPGERRKPLGRVVVADVAVARHPVDGVGHRLLEQLQCAVKVVQPVAEEEQRVGGLVIEHPPQVAQAAMDVGND